MADQNRYNLSNFKTVHNTGTVRLVYKNEIIETKRYNWVLKRTEILREWYKKMDGKKYHIELVPDWDKWNGKFKLGNKKHERLFAAATN